MFSKACEYAIRAAVFIAVQSLEGRRVSVQEIAQKTDSPIAFTAKILQQLSKNGTIRSVKGPAGGFEIDRGGMERANLSMIVQAIDGNAIYEGCGLGLKQCNALLPCPLHDRFVTIRADLKEMLESTTLYELAFDVEKQATYLKR